VSGAARAASARAWWLAPACLAGVFLLDALLSRPVPYAALGVGDELAHLLTTVVIVLTLLVARNGRLGTAFVAGALVAGNLIDLDHLPLMLGHDVLTRGTPRPYSHSLTFLLVLLLLARLCRGRVGAALYGAAVGVGGHLTRDVATAPVALFWPASWRAFEIPYGVYAVVLTGFACAVAVRSWSRRRRSSSDAHV
jgi:LexA-binding, inner membrane-associated putative hydrolase